MWDMLQRSAVGRAPNKPLPTRTIVDPHATAILKSLVMPIEHTVKPCSETSRRSKTKDFSHSDTEPSVGPMVIRPATRSPRGLAA